MGFAGGRFSGPGRRLTGPAGEDVSADAAHFRDEVAALEKAQSHRRHQRWLRTVRRVLRIAPPS